MRKNESITNLFAKEAAVLFATDIAARGLGKKTSFEKIFCDQGLIRSIFW